MPCTSLQSKVNLESVDNIFSVLNIYAESKQLFSLKPFEFVNMGLSQSIT